MSVVGEWEEEGKILLLAFLFRDVMVEFSLKYLDI